MSEVKPWEEAPDEEYWHILLGARTPLASNAAPPEPPAPSGWTIAESSYAQGTILELRVVGYNRGGLLVDLGDVRGFVPASQLTRLSRQVTEDARRQELARYVGSNVRVKVIEFDRARNRLILSERVVNPPPSRAEQLLATIEPNQTRHGIVRNVTDFGAFVDLGGVEGLIHVSELSWQYVAHPRDILSPGQEVEVYIIEVDREQKRIACSLKRLQPNPWQEIADKTRPGDWVEGTITTLVPFGAFVRLAEGVEGLVHISEIEGEFTHPSEVVQEGQTVRVRVVEIDAAQQRARLSLRRNESKTEHAGTRQTNRHRVPPPPPLDPGYWESLILSE